MTLTELIKDFIDTSKERLKTPISGAFLWSFLLYNWRPIFLLVFSDASIEDKIIVINHEYCNFWALFVPFFLALFYTILVPKLMLQIDKSLIETKEERIDNIYQEKEHLVDKKTTLAGKEFLLKSAESGNKEIQQLNDEIESLKEQNSGLQESFKQINDSNKITIEELNTRLKASNDTILQLQRNYDSSGTVRDNELRKFSDLYNTVVGDTLHLEQALVEEVLKSTERISFDEYEFLRRSVVNKNGQVQLTYSLNSDEMIRSLIQNNIIEHYSSPKNKIMSIGLTPVGLILHNIIKTT